MGLHLATAILVFSCAVLAPTLAEEDNFYSREYSKDMLRKLESEIFAKTSPMQPVDYLMLYVIELKQGMNVLNDTVSAIGREYHDLWKQEVERLPLDSNPARCDCDGRSSSEVRELQSKVDALREDVRLLVEELRNTRTAPAAAYTQPPTQHHAAPAAAYTQPPTQHHATPPPPSPPPPEEQVDQVVKNYTGPSNWRNVKRSLEYVLDPTSTAYQQLQDVGPQDTTPLKSAAEKGYVELLEVLLDKGLPVDTMADDVWRYDLLSAAAISGQVLVVELLLSRGAQTEVTNNRGVTPLMFAASKNHLAVVKALVQHNADLGRRNYDGHTALDLARRRNNREVVEYLSAFAAAEPDQLPASH